MDIKNIIEELTTIYTYRYLAEQTGKSIRQIHYYARGESEPPLNVGLQLIELHKKGRAKIKRAKQ